jgi:hypothetical protein
MVVQGGLREEGFRDNETWVLGPLGAAAGAAAWRWFEVQGGGGAQSPERPSPRFHHTVSGVRGGAGLLVVGGHDHRIRPILQPWALSLGELAVGEDGGARNTATVRWHNHDEDELGAEDKLPAPRAHHAAVGWSGYEVAILPLSPPFSRL